MNKEEQTYEQAMAELEKLTRQMESGELPIDQMAATLKKAQLLATKCRQQLLQVEQQIKEVL